MNRWLLALVLALLCTPNADAQSVDTPMNFTKKFSGDQGLRFTSGGRPVKPTGARMSYRVISNAQEWKKVWGYLYDDTVKVDFKNQVVLAVFKSPANGAYDIVPKRVFAVQDDLNLDLDVVWNGKTNRAHPFMFLVVKRFKNLYVQETFVAPQGKTPRYP